MFWSHPSRGAILCFGMTSLPPLRLLGKFESKVKVGECCEGFFGLLEPQNKSISPCLHYTIVPMERTAFPRQPPRRWWREKLVGDQGFGTFYCPLTVTHVPMSNQMFTDTGPSRKLFTVASVSLAYDLLVQ